MPARSSKSPVRLMDTTLRDGEQTPDVAFSSEEKLKIAQHLLARVRIDRVEIGSALVSAGERSMAERVATWARDEGRLSQIEMLGFVDGERSIAWVRGTGVRRMNLLVKGSEQHCREQLGLTPEEHWAGIEATLSAARRAEVEIAGVYLEDWSRGIGNSPSYVGNLIAALQSFGVSCVYLADTLGVLNPEQVLLFTRRTLRAFPHLQFEFHAHDDYGLATANCLAAARAGVHGLHTTVNGLGERAGNACLAQVAVALRDHAGRATAVDEAELCAASQLVAAASGQAVAANAPLLGASAFTQTAGIHADGDAKAGLYRSRLAPERFARRHEYALGKLSGRASLAHHLNALGLDPSAAERRALLERVVALGDRKERVRGADLERWLASVRDDARERW
ncbi:MAG TPA: hypothetical protein VG963_08575 [Polyangiaceae bacterium]|nr:hypothetical protein [Polyangiaceae bacterium]